MLETIVTIAIYWATLSIAIYVALKEVIRVVTYGGNK